MPTRRRIYRGRWTADHLAEMGSGRLLTGVLRPSQCGYDDLGHPWCPVCDTGFDCRSNFDSEDEREAFYWSRRDEILADSHPGRRPWSFWRYEAPGLCRHKPRCPLPTSTGDYRTTVAADRDWLDRHDALATRERSVLAREDDEEEASRAAAEAARDPRSHWAGCTCPPCQQQPKETP